MKNFKQHFNEASIPNWTSLVGQNKELQAALGLIAEIERLGGEALIVGGAVRDLMMGNQPHDIDLATNVDLNKIPKHLLDLEDPIFAFNKEIIDATHHLAIAYKPNIAFYEAYGLNGWKALTKQLNT